ncbi:MAG: YiiD C-terminal domain-containing protein [Ignavibacteriaceae bacterium]
MDILKIPFVNKVGLKKNSDGVLELAIEPEVQNHLQSIHAGAQFTLAETASGELLQTLFPELVENVIPVLRDAQIKFKCPAQKTITAHPSIPEEKSIVFKNQLLQKGRALIEVNVEVKDAEGVVTCSGVFNWFIQKIK